jgi:hypothetical protein
VWNQIVGGAYFEATHHPYNLRMCTLKVSHFSRETLLVLSAAKSARGIVYSFGMSSNNYVELECSQSPARFCKSITSFLDQMAAWDEGAKYCDAIEAAHKFVHSLLQEREPVRMAFHKPQTGSVQKQSVHLCVELQINLYIYPIPGTNR